MRSIVFNTLFFVVLLLLLNQGKAQSEHSHDSSYYDYSPHHLMIRLVASQQFSAFYFRAKEAGDIAYHGSPKFQVGAGFSKNWFAISGAISVGNLHDKGKGNTKSTNLQLQFYPRHWYITTNVSLNKGYHLGKGEGYPLNSDTYYYRPDVHLNFFSLAAFQMANADKFSFRSAIGQAAWQKRSAGSLLYGGIASYGSIKGDSVLVPAKYGNTYLQAGINRVNFLHIGPGIGYAYTFVAGKHFFLMVSLISDLNLNITSEEKSGGSTSKWTVAPGGIYRAALGYNSSIWSVAAEAGGNGLLINGTQSGGGYFMHGGLYRLVVGRKFNAK